MDIIDCDVVVIGAGVVGLAIGREISKKHSSVIILESHKSFGNETSSRNSEVIHAGIYYTPESLKSLLCIEGKKLLFNYCYEKKISFSLIGKLIVAKDLYQSKELMNIYNNALSCNMRDVEILHRSELKSKFAIHDLHSAIFSPTTGIIDSHALMQNLETDFINNGGTCAYNSRVTGGVVVGPYQIETIVNDDFILRSRYVINAAGLNAVDIRQIYYENSNVRVYKNCYAVGHYLKYNGKVPFRNLIYPLPEKGGLGTHLTFDLKMQPRFGPDLHYVKKLQYREHHLDKIKMCDAIRAYWPDIDFDKLSFDYCGIRPKVTADEQLVNDFIIEDGCEQHAHGLINLLGIESPGLTASLAIGRYVEHLVNL